MEIRVYYEDTDCGNVVYYANYLRYFERARTEFLRSQGIDFSHWMREGLLFTVAEVNAKYHAPAVYDDVLYVSTRVTEIRKVRFGLEHEIIRKTNGELLITGGTTMACVSGGKPARIPKEILTALETARS